ncbi:hypothetical protein SDC9_106860 [bioreactor metagenome]|uniref:CAAX prenyl protease 2/Lysostaphin resistance protein A-like domain-containing protein n=1 Tax=bioreactor metagenome TaxID=1076179 RepID=A0A645BA35_9ZZZZ
MIGNGKSITVKRINIYLFLVLGFYYACGIIAFVLPNESGKKVFSFLAVIFTAIPLLATVITRKITKDNSSWNLNLKVWKDWKMWLFSAFIPAVSILLGAILFYCIFPNDLDYSGKYLIQHFSGYGVPSVLNLTIPSMLKMGIVIVIISAIALPIHLLELGEEVGWRGYLLPMLCERMTVRKAVILNGALWGTAHAPLIYFGFNYGLDYKGAPFTGILMMIVVCVVLGIFTSYVTIKTGNCMYASIIHGSVNVIGETAVFVSLSTQSTLLGPNPTGIIGISVLIMGSIILFVQMKNLNFEKHA